MSILHITSSARGLNSESSKLSRLIVDRLLALSPRTSVVERDLGLFPLEGVGCDYATSVLLGGHVPRDSAPTAFHLSEQLIGEIEAAGHVVIGTPMHNFCVPSALKTWIDYVVRRHRTFTYNGSEKVGLLADRPVLIAVAGGGSFTEGSERHPDFLTPYLRLVLRTIGLTDVTFFSAQRLAGDKEVAEKSREAFAKSVEEYFSRWRF